jgi:hypothetical protein
MVITIQIQNATDDNVIKLSGKLRSFIRKLDLWQSTMGNSNLDMFSTLRLLKESSKRRISIVV